MHRLDDRERREWYDTATTMRALAREARWPWRSRLAYGISWAIHRIERALCLALD
ncbi:MAG: hypothetical protein HY720_12650 [Planctomycetes bacterium]|nr:hypothetical protein [Planctomycetota bacterium]